jgi:tol-pal system protein YbgF
MSRKRAIVGVENARGCGLVLAAFLAAFPLSPPAEAQQTDTRALQQRIERLESDLAILQRQVYTGGGPSGGAPAAGGAPAPSVAASLELRVSQLEEQLQALTGRIEEVGHNVDVAKAELDRLTKDVDFRLSALEHGGAAAPAPGAEGGAASAAPKSQLPVPTPAPGAGGRVAAPQQALAGTGQVLPVGTPQQQYDFARALLIQQDYPGAEKAFNAFVTTHPDDALAGPAQYWLGETFYSRNNYDQAAKAFAEGYQRYPKSAKAPDTLLKLGMSLIQLNRKKDACVLFNELNQKYPAAAANVKQAAQRERQRAGCT